MGNLNSLTIGELGSYTFLAITVLGVFFEVSPIKFNPISMFLGWVGKRMNRSLEEKIEKIEGKVDDLERKTDDNEVYRLRHEILDFSNSCQNGRLHTQEEFDHILDALVRYEEIIEKRGLKNGQIEQAHKYLERLYQRMCDDNSFLK